MMSNNMYQNQWVMAVVPDESADIRELSWDYQSSLPDPQLAKDTPADSQNSEQY